MMSSDSETAKLLHEAHRKNDRAEIARLEELYEAEVRQRLDAARSSFDAVKEQHIASASSSKERTGATKRYKELIKLYRDAVALSKEISVYKKLMREG